MRSRIKDSFMLKKTIIGWSAAIVGFLFFVFLYIGIINRIVIKRSLKISNVILHLRLSLKGILNEYPLLPPIILLFIVFVLLVVCYMLADRKRKFINIYKKPKTLTEAHVLAPLDDLYHDAKYDNSTFKVYAAKLNSAFSNHNVTNIAIIGNWGVGKSSIIRSFDALRNKSNHRFLYISLLDYKSNIDYHLNAASETTSDERDDQVSGCYEESAADETVSGIDQQADRGSNAVSNHEKERQNLENYLLSNILAVGNEVKLPDSGYKLIPKKGSLRYHILIVLLSIFVFSTVFALLYDKIWPSDTAPLFGIAKAVYFGITALSLSLSLILILPVIIKRITVESITIKTAGQEATLKKKTANTEYIDKRLFEMMYAIENIAKKINYTVVFEDLDRINPDVCAEIFSNICRVSKLVNARRSNKNKIRFVYAFNDKIFEKSKRYKYFDYILSVYPLMTRNTAGDLMLEKFRAIIGEQINEYYAPAFWELLGQCVYDMRLLNCIVDSFEVFVSKMRSVSPIIDKKWLPYVIYKNLLPNDYHISLGGESILAKAATNRNEKIEAELKDYSKPYRDSVCRLMSYFLEEELIDESVVSYYMNGEEPRSLSINEKKTHLLDRYYAIGSPSTKSEFKKMTCALNDLAKLYEENYRDYAAVVEEYNKLVELVAKNKDYCDSVELGAAYLKLGVAYEKYGKYTEAIANYTNARDQYMQAIATDNLIDKIDLALQRVNALSSKEKHSDD